MQLKSNSVGVSRTLLVLVVVAVLHLATTAHAYPMVSAVSDKVNHMSAFFVLTGLVRFAFPRRGWRFALAVLMGFGVLIEFIQYFLPYRESSGLDLMADLAGVVAYAVASALVPPLRRSLATR